MLAGRSAVVSGASRGIGRAIALELARSGVRVHAVARDRAALELLARECQGIVAQATDLTDSAAIEDLSARLRAEPGSIDILVHSAGMIAHAPTRSANVGDLDRMMQVNLRGAYCLTQELLPQLIENAGDIIFINSLVTQFPRAVSGQYAATKHALIGFANSLREEVNALGVRVLSIYPGKTATPGQERLCRDAGEPYQTEFMLDPQDVAEMAVAALNLPRRAEVTEIRMRPFTKSPARQ